MNVYYITFRSVTYAQRGERVLRGQGIPSVLRRTPKWMEERGCGYSLQLLGQDIHQVRSVLEESRVPYGRIYRQGESGGMEVVQP